jgi:hypothetical protein
MLSIDPSARQVAKEKKLEMIQLTVYYDNGKKCMEFSGCFLSKAIQKGFWRWFTALAKEANKQHEAAGGSEEDHP